MIKPEDLIQAKFSRAFLGYDMKEVDTLLDAVIEQMEAWEKERQEMLTALEYLLQEIEQYEHQQDGVSHRRDAARALHAEKSARLTQGKTQTEQPRAETTREKSKMRSKPMPKPRREDPMPQPVADAVEEQQMEIPLAKIPAASAEPEFEIPTYVFAGTSGAETTQQTSAEESAVPVAEEMETAVEAQDFVEPQQKESPNSMEQEA